MSAVIDLPESKILETDHHQFNLAVWNHISNDPMWTRLEFRLETDQHGQVIMSPPPAPSHGRNQSKIARILGNQMTSGEVISECPISTSGGVKAADDAWCSDKVWASAKHKNCFVTCPELCVEVLSPSNTTSEIEEKKRLYFAAGAKEVWICDLDGQMQFLTSPNTTKPKSKLFPDFPQSV